MTKFDGCRTREAATRQIDESLKRLQTDHVDLIQFHETIRLEDPDRFFAEGGALEAVVAARKAGKARFIGFTGHKDPQVHLRMLSHAADRGFRFDAVQMPLNVMDAHFRSFGQQVLLPRLLVKEQIGVLGMKPMGSGQILNSKTGDADRVPAIRVEPAHFGSDHGHRQPANSQADGSAPHARLSHSSAAFEVVRHCSNARQRRRCHRPVREIQNRQGF